MAVALATLMVGACSVAEAQLTDRTEAPNTTNSGIAKSLTQQIGAGVGNVMTPGSSTYVIQRDPARAIRRGRQLFQRKFRIFQGLGPRTADGIGDLDQIGALGAGVSDSCAGCHGRPRGSAGFGGDVVTRPDSRDAPHLFGLGLKEMLGDEMTTELRAIRAQAIDEARRTRRSVSRDLIAKGVRFGSIRASQNGTVDTSAVEGVDPDLRVRPFFAHGGTISIREFIIGALRNEMGLEAVDPLVLAAFRGGRVVTPTGMVLDGRTDSIEDPVILDANHDNDRDGKRNEIPASLIDFFEMYLVNYFKPATYRTTDSTRSGLKSFKDIGCASCHVPDLTVNRDRRVADVETVYDPKRGSYNGLFAAASLRLTERTDTPSHPSLKTANGQPFLVKNFFSDLKRHDLGPNFHERNYNGVTTTKLMTLPLWGVGSTPPYGHDGRSINLREVILRHGGEAKRARDRFAALSDSSKAKIIGFLDTLVLFPPDDTASNLDPGDPTAPGFPQNAHGSIRLGALFNDPTEPE